MRRYKHKAWRKKSQDQVKNIGVAKRPRELISVSNSSVLVNNLA
jgi:hypothetical protein